jgi:hypothetical protein
MLSPNNKAYRARGTRTSIYMFRPFFNRKVIRETDRWINEEGGKNMFSSFERGRERTSAFLVEK